MLGLAYRGTGNNKAIQKLLRFAVSDVSDDVRRAAVLNLGREAEGRGVSLGGSASGVGGCDLGFGVAVKGIRS